VQNANPQAVDSLASLAARPIRGSSIPRNGFSGNSAGSRHQSGISGIGDKADLLQTSCIDRRRFVVRGIVWANAFMIFAVYRPSMPKGLAI
jgi:hypothetical protein